MKKSCKRLWAAVLEQAVRDAHGYNISLKEDALEWFRSKNKGVGSFLRICFILELNPKFIQITLAGEYNEHKFMTSSRPAVSFHLQRATH